MPLTLTQLFIATSEKQDIKMTARVFSADRRRSSRSRSTSRGRTSALSGGIYYWSTIPNPPKATQENAPATPPTYILLDTDQTSGTAIYRYDFTNGTAGADGDWTDDGGPKSTPPYQGAPAGGEQQRRQGSLHRLPRDQQRRQVHGADDRRFGERRGQHGASSTSASRT